MDGSLDSGYRRGQTLLQEARQATSEFTEIAGSGGPLAAGFYCAAAEVVDDVYAVAVGPKAAELADNLYRRVPTRFVAPGMGNFRRDLQAKKPGLYVIGKSVTGPLTVEEAMRLLPSTLTLTPTP